MRKTNYKGRCTKKARNKCKSMCRTYDPIQFAYADILQADPQVISFQCNVVLDGLECDGEYMSDFLIEYADGRCKVIECVQRKYLTKPQTVKLLDASHSFWQSKGIEWGLVIDAEK